MKSWTSGKDGSKSAINKVDDEITNDIDEALNELGMLSSLTQTRREKWLRRRCYRFSNGKNAGDSSHWCSSFSSSSASSSCSGSSQGSGSLGGSIPSRKNSYSSASSGSSGSSLPFSSTSSSSPFSSLSFSLSSRSSQNSYSSFEATNNVSLSSSSSGFQSSCCSSSSSIYASLDLVGDASGFSNYKIMEYPRVARRHHFHNQCYKPYTRPRRCSLQSKDEPLDLNWNLLKGLSLSDSGSSGTGSGTGTPPPFLACSSSNQSSSPSSNTVGTTNSDESKLLCSKINSCIADKENNALETRSNPNSPIRNRNMSYFLNHTHSQTLPLKSNHYHHSSTTHQLTSSSIHNHQNHLNSHHHPEINPLTTSVNSIFGSSVVTQGDNLAELPGCSNCGKPGDRHFFEQGSIFRSRSLDDLNNLLLQEEINHHHTPNCPPDGGIFNQPMFSPVSCDIENVLQKISRLEM